MCARVRACVRACVCGAGEGERGWGCVCVNALTIFSHMPSLFPSLPCFVLFFSFFFFGEYDTLLRGRMIQGLEPAATCPHSPNRPVGLVVKASASREEDPGFESRLRQDYFGVESYQ